MNDQLNKARKKGIKNFCDQLSYETISAILEILDNSGIDTDTELFLKDMSLTNEALRATIYRSMGISHHLHDFIDNHLTVVSRDEFEKEEPDEKESGNEGEKGDTEK